jgi:hypothetical protein
LIQINSEGFFMVFAHKYKILIPACYPRF